MATGTAMKHPKAPDDVFYAVDDDQVRVLEKGGWKKAPKSEQPATAPTKES